MKRSPHGKTKFKSKDAIYHGCGSKRRFKTGTEAQKVAEKLGMEYYVCLHCYGWHLTSRNKND